MSNENEVNEFKEQAGCLAIGISFLIPIVGVIIYFVNKGKVKNPSAYLYAALGGVAFVVIASIIRSAGGAS